MLMHMKRVSLNWTVGPSIGRYRLPRYNEQLVINLVLFIFSALVLNDLGVRTWTKHHFLCLKTKKEKIK